MNRCGSYNCKPRSNLWKHWFIHSC
uniref:Photosystem II protein T n=1 Tax=Magnolia lacei TaxID=86764 RepID=A0A8K1I4A8_9MAGN|nr:photosystem II protein T [Magnolia lacei]UBU95878.1 photosystem II protein T [Magnolia lacei]